MDNKKCQTCSEYKSCRDSFSSWVFFIIGIIATIAVRVVTVLIHVDPVYAKVAWYIGITGFFMFFVYKFKVSEARSRLINEKGLLDKLNKGEHLEEEDSRAIGNILCGVTSRKERINYFFIFGLSAVALALAVYMDFFK